MILLRTVTLLLLLLVTVTVINSVDLTELFTEKLKEAHKRWNNARQELNLDTIPFIDNDRHKNMNAFYRSYHGSSIYDISNKPIVYVNVWQAWSDEIKENLALNEIIEKQDINLESGDDKHIRYKIINGVTAAYEPYVLDYNRLLRKKSFNNTQGIGAFMFVREPISHFLSGISDYHYLYKKRPRDEPFSTGDLKKEIIAILNGKKYIDWVDELQYSRALPMVGSLWKNLKIKFIGRIEHMEKDWDNFQKFYGVELLPLNMSMSFRPKAVVDPLGVMKAFEKLVNYAPYYVRALCNILYLDYEVFGYRLPTMCNSLDEVSTPEMRLAQSSLTIPNGTLIRFIRDRRVHLVKDNEKMPIKDFKVFLKYGFDLDQVQVIHDRKKFDSIPETDAVE